jgi:hypothetical protein
MKRKKLTGWGLIVGALLLLSVREFVPNLLIGLFTSVAAMLVGGIGIYMAFDDREERS